MALPTSGAEGQGVYWLGADGNIYLKSAETGWNVQNQGTSLAPWSSTLINSWQQVSDPSGSQQEQTPPPGGGGGGGGTGATLNTAGISNTQKTIDEIPGLLEAALDAERTRYGNTTRQFAEEETGQRKTYDGSTVTNQKNYDSNFMDSIRAGIKGLGGLMSLLRGTGAGGGTAEDIARDTVGGVTATDIRGGADTRDENQTALDASLGNFLTELGRKRSQNEDAYANNRSAVRRDSNTQLQDLFGKMAGFYGDVGDEANATSWMNRAGDLTPEIARDSRTQVSPYDTAPVAVKAPELTAFAAPTQPSVVTAPGGQVGSGIFTMTDPKRRRETVPVGV